jgi:DNA-binding transcriptional MerR regulator
MATTYSTGEAARKIGVSRQTLQAWIAKEIMRPKTIGVGGTTVRLWTDADIQKGRKFKGTLKPGRKVKK